MARALLFLLAALSGSGCALTAQYDAATAVNAAFGVLKKAIKAAL